MQLFYSPDILEGNFSLDKEESRHAIKVLRLKKGDTFDITDGKGKVYTASISDITKSVCRFSIHQTLEIPKRKHSIHIAIAPTKNIDRIEWFVEKATELGINKISFIQCKNSERKVVNMERIQKKAISAMKQSGQAWLPQIQSISTFEQALNTEGLKFIAHVDPANSKNLKQVAPNENYVVLIGPEGDFTHDEINMATSKGFEKISLGQTTLRTETAGLIACHILNLINE